MIGSWRFTSGLLLLILNALLPLLKVNSPRVTLFSILLSFNVSLVFYFCIVSIICWNLYRSSPSHSDKSLVTVYLPLHTFWLFLRRCLASLDPFRESRWVLYCDLVLAYGVEPKLGGSSGSINSPVMPSYFSNRDMPRSPSSFDLKSPMLLCVTLPEIAVLCLD